jgi:hypothetical protein
VEILLMNREFPVDGPTAANSFRCVLTRGPLPTGRVHLLSYVASLDRTPCLRTIPPRSTHSIFFADTVAADVYRYQESIEGHPYLIEATPVSKDRWRAYIVRIPGVPTALMPFYGSTPAEAAQQLCDWLARAHRQAAASGRSV